MVIEEGFSLACDDALSQFNMMQQCLNAVDRISDSICLHGAPDEVRQRSLEHLIQVGSAEAADKRTLRVLGVVRGFARSIHNVSQVLVRYLVQLSQPLPVSSPAEH